MDANDLFDPETEKNLKIFPPGENHVGNKFALAVIIGGIIFIVLGKLFHFL